MRNISPDRTPHLQAAWQAVSLPILRKDFTIDEYQLYESRAIGADAILLMAQVLDRDTFKQLLEKAYELGLHALAEGHTGEQIDFLVSTGARTIGINNRDFTTMKVDINTTLIHRNRVPNDRVPRKPEWYIHTSGNAAAGRSRSRRDPGRHIDHGR